MDDLVAERARLTQMLTAELHATHIGEKLIAETVVDFVNDTAGALLAKYPDLHIQFGLHAWSVKNHTEYIAKVDPRVYIVWENCGAFPFEGEFGDVGDDGNAGDLGATRAFVEKIFPEVCRLFPEQMAGYTAEDLYRAVNRAQPSLIRTEADEVTYSLHIMVRYELEKQLIL